MVGRTSVGECFPWTPKPLYDLSTLEPEILGEMNDTVTCVVLCEGCDEATKAQVTEALNPVASEAFEAAKAAGCEAGMLFFTASATSDVVYQLRMSCDLGEPTNVPQVSPLHSRYCTLPLFFGRCWRGDTCECGRLVHGCGTLPARDLLADRGVGHTCE